MAVLAVLFFGWLAGAAAQTNNVVLPAKELQVVLEQVGALQAQAAQREAVIRALQESLAVARAENELLRQQWAEARGRAQVLGANPGDREAVVAQRQLVAAAAAQAELVAQLTRLVAAVESRANVEAELRRAKELVRPSQPRATTGTLAAAKVVDVSAPLRLAVLDVGALQGARVGMPVQVWRQDRLVAELRIVDVRPRVSGALIERVEQGVTVQAGDAVRVTGNETDGKR